MERTSKTFRSSCDTRTAWITLDVYTQAVNSSKRAHRTRSEDDGVRRGQKGEESAHKQRSSGLIGPLSDPDLIVTVGRYLILSLLESVAGRTGGRTRPH